MTNETMRMDYRAYVAEQRACGLEYLSFKEWSGQDSGSSRARAEARWNRMEEDDTLDSY